MEILEHKFFDLHDRVDNGFQREMILASNRIAAVDVRKILQVTLYVHSALLPRHFVFEIEEIELWDKNVEFFEQIGEMPSLHRISIALLYIQIAHFQI